MILDYTIRNSPVKSKILPAELDFIQESAYPGTMTRLFVIVIGIVLLLVGGIFVISALNENEEEGGVSTISPTSSSATSSPMDQEIDNAYDDEIRITAPTAGSAITSPVTIRGEARGTWYFEGSFSATLYGGDGKELGTGVITAQDEWMTEDFVPFFGEITFSDPSVEQGELILHAANPSGLPSNERQITIPVTF